MANNQISAVSIKRLWYSDPIDKEPTLTSLMGAVTKVENVHQDTWTLEESEPSQDSYKNQLTGLVYRMGRKEMGEITANFTIGRYDYVLKQSFMGGSVIFENGLVLDDKDAIAMAQGSCYVKGGKLYKDESTANADQANTENDGKAFADGLKAVGWQRARGSVEVRKTLYALTDDDQLCVISYANLNAYEGDSDGAIGIVIQGMALDPKAAAVAPEYWFDVSTGYTISDSGITPKA